MSVKRQTLALGLFAAALSQSSWAQSDVVSALIKQGHYWQAQGQPDHAEQAWQKLLATQPQQPDALYGLAIIAIGRNQMSVAQGYLTRLQVAAPNSLLVLKLEQDLRLAVEPGKSALAKARLMGQDASNAGSATAMAAAIAQYNVALGGKTPQGDVALEYYTYLGYTDGGIDPAIAGLQRLNQEDPGNPKVMLALAEHTARNESTRVQGIRQLQALAKRPDIGGAADEFWRIALTWLGAPRPPEVPLFQAYLAVHPDDAEIRKQMQQVRPVAKVGRHGKPIGPPQDPRLTRGYAALRNNDFATADSAFSSMLRTNPNDPGALGGLGVVRMEQKNLPEAQSLLARAVARPGGERWRRSLNIARYWLLVQQGNEALQANQPLAAREKFQQAIRFDSRETAARDGLGQVYLAQNDVPGAEKTFTAVLNSNPNDQDALGGMFTVYARTGRADQADRLLQRMTPAQQAGVGDMGRLRAQMAQAQARDAQQRGDQAGAQKALESALSDDPDNPWIRLDLAHYYLQNGHESEARGLVDGLLLTNPTSPDALYASALLSMQLGNWQQAQDTLAKIPESARTAGIKTTSQQVYVHVQAAKASEMAQDGNAQGARDLLAQLEPVAGNNPDMLGTIAQAYVDAGDYPRGLNLLRQLMTGGVAQAKPDVLLPYAGLLLKTQQDVEAAGVLRQLQSDTLNDGQQQQLQNLIFLYTVRQADLLRQRGDLVEAYNTLAPALAKRPHDSNAIGVLARMYSDRGEYDKALTLYKDQTQRDPHNSTVWLGAAQTAVADHQNSYAQDALEHAVASGGDDPDVMSSAANIYRQMGKTGRAESLLESAIAIKQKRQQSLLAMALPKPSPQAEASVSDNPFASPPSANSGPVLPSAALAQAQLDVPAPVDGETTEQGTPENVSSANAVLGLPTASGTAVATASPVGDSGTTASGVAAGQTAAAAAVAGDQIPTATASSVPSTQVLTPAINSSGSPQNVTVPVTTARAPAPANDSTSLASMQSQLADIQAQRSPEIRAGLTVQSNNGAGGMSKSTIVQEPTEMLMPAGDGKVTVQVTPVQINAGGLSSNQYLNSQFGGGPVAAEAQAAGTTGGAGSQHASGVGLDVGYVMQTWNADIGTTPLGFRETNILGGVQYHDSINAQNGSWFSVGASRRAVTDSLTSFAGAHDDRTGQTWGGVTASGVQGQIGVDKPKYGVYGYGSWQYLDGSNVASNTRSEVGAGIYWYLLHDTNRLLTAGVNLDGMFYDKNENYFTYGNGGYFSPQHFYSVSLPVTWAQRFDRFSYKVQGSVGLQYFHQASADYFPTSSELQSAAAASTLGNGGVYGASSKTDVGYNLSTAAEYQLSSKWFVGGTASINNSSDYRQWAVGLYLRYTFYPQTQPVAMPVIPFQSPYTR